VTIALPLDAEWLESDAMGGFASGTLAGYRTRRYHALLLTSRRPPTDRVVLVNGIEAWVDAAGSSFPLSTQHYAPDVIYPRGMDHLAYFTPEPWPIWTFDGPDGLGIRQELLVDARTGRAPHVAALRNARTRSYACARCCPGANIMRYARERRFTARAPTAVRHVATARGEPPIAALTN
jgi:glycogen debranching enzyme